MEVPPRPMNVRNVAQMGPAPSRQARFDGTADSTMQSASCGLRFSEKQGSSVVLVFRDTSRDGWCRWVRESGGARGGVMVVIGAN